MSAAGEDLDLLLSLGGDRVPETPPGSPSSRPPHFSGYNSDDASPRRNRLADMSVFRDTVKDYLDPELTAHRFVHSEPRIQKKSGEVVIERFSGLRIRDQILSSIELTNRFADVRFVRLSVIRNLLSGDNLAGSWATVGVLTEKGATKIFLFGDACKMMSCNERVGTVFALFNSNVRKDDNGKGFSLSVYSVSQVLKIGTSADYGVCKGKRKDGEPCTMVINKNRGMYCKYHSSKAPQQYTTARAELKGGNFQMTFRPKQEGVYVLDPQAGRLDGRRTVQPAKVMSVDGLKKVLSTANKVTTNSHSQGIRFLGSITGNAQPNLEEKKFSKPEKIKALPEKRNTEASRLPSKDGMGKRNRTSYSSVNMIELDIVSSDEES
ncbi:hypothetical protein HPP92_008341 [Vanilla planifolia]|uniref:Zinc finger Mcm10/DnaG-type domain-containing protein n=1 Tax=Vanilla planifolia TaxID=51239 RepID=A0A835RDH5_VANPL|nr:hypothetical protein HPP92_008341 [Vanilla planifolia]